MTLLSVAGAAKGKFCGRSSGPDYSVTREDAQSRIQVLQLSEGAMETGSKGQECFLLFKSIVVMAEKMQCVL